MLSILIVEDGIAFSLILTTWLSKKGFVIKSSPSVSDAKRRLREGALGLVISDLHLPDSNGVGLLKWLESTHPSLPLIMVTSYAEVQTAVQTMKLGAADYIAKPLNLDELLGKIKELMYVEGKAPARALVSSAPDFYIEGQSQTARQLYEHVCLVAPTDMSVLVTDTGSTGKEYIVRRIHEQSNRNKTSFVAVNCGAIPKELTASEFFGHVEDSFTGTIENKTGAFVAVQGGTIFLGEIGNLTYEVQVQLLRALQERRVKPIGSNQEIAIDVRLISATNRNLRQATEKGDFRKDLCHRINESTIRTSDLKERKGDLLLSASHFLDLANGELQKDAIDFGNDTCPLYASPSPRDSPYGSG